jgi:hypothetical protein
LLEDAIYQRVTSLPGVTLRQGYNVTGLTVDETGRRVTGVGLSYGRGTDWQERKLAADLVVDSSGRNSRAPEWLAALGFRPPEEWRVNAFVGYASRLYEIPAAFDDRWKTLYVRPTPPDDTRGGIVLTMEDGRWCVTLIGTAGDYPPTDDAGFMEYARSLATPELYDAICEARPLSKLRGFRRTENRVRRYDDLPRYLEGFLVMGARSGTGRSRR